MSSVNLVKGYYRSKIAIIVLSIFTLFSFYKLTITRIIVFIGSKKKNYVV